MLSVSQALWLNGQAGNVSWNTSGGDILILFILFIIFQSTLDNELFSKHQIFSIVLMLLNKY